MEISFPAICMTFETFNPIYSTKQSITPQAGVKD